MSRLATDTTIHKTLREFVIALNRAENAQARGAVAHELGELHNAVRDASQAVEEALMATGWLPPNRMIRLPQPDISLDATPVISETGVGLEY